MRAIYLRSIKSPVGRGGHGFVFRKLKKLVNDSDIFSQANVEQDSDYLLDSFCVESDGTEMLDESMSEITIVDNVPSESCDKNEGKKRKRIIVQSDSSDGEVSPAKSMDHIASPVLSRTATSTSDHFTLTREERLKKQKEKQEEFRRKMASSSTSSSHVFIKPSLPKAQNGTSTSVRVLVSSRQVSNVPEVISHLRVELACPTHILSFDEADFVLTPRLGVIRKLYSDFVSSSNRSKLQEQIHRLTALFDNPYLILEADKEKASRDRGNNATANLTSTSILFKTHSSSVYLTLASLAQTQVTVLHSCSQRETASLLNALAKRESLKGFVVPDVEKLSAKQDMVRQFLQRIPEINPAVSIVMATQFSNLRQILTSSAEVISKKCQISITKAREIIRAFQAEYHPK